MSDQPKRIDWGAILGAAVGIGAAAYLISHYLTEEPISAGGAAPNRYQFHCPWQTPQRELIAYVVETFEECKYATKIIKQHCESYRVLGFDVEFGSNGDAALLQLATHQGVCILIRLCQLVNLPDELSTILADPQIIKVGVGSRKDAAQLRKVGVCVTGTLDLRYVAGPDNLRDMTKRVLGHNLVNGGHHQWHTDELNERHVKYAAEDALAGVEIFKNLERAYISKGGFFENRDTDSYLKQFHNKFGIDFYV